MAEYLDKWRNSLYGKCPTLTCEEKFHKMNRERERERDIERDREKERLWNLIANVQDRRLAPGDTAILMKHKDLLEDRLERFISSSGSLRAMLAFQQDQDVMVSRLAEQRDHLLEKLARAQDAHQVYYLVSLIK